MLLERGHRRPSRPARRPDEVEQVAQPHAASSRRWRSSPRRRRSAGGRRLRHRERGRPGSATSTVAVHDSRRYAGSVALARDPGGPGGLVDRQLLPGPSPERTPSTETLRSHGTVLPAVSSTAAPEASQAVRSRPRRDRPLGSRPARSCSGRRRRRQGLPDDRQLDRDVHDERADRDPGDGVVGGPEARTPRGTTASTLTRPVASWKIAAATSTPIEARSATCSSSSRGRPRRPDRRASGRRSRA